MIQSIPNHMVNAGGMLPMASKAALLNDARQSAVPSPANPATSAQPSGGVTDTVTLSSEATAAMATGASLPINGYNKYFPVRAGFTSTALSDAATDPGKQTSSAGKNFDEVAADARTRMDVKYVAMAVSGKPYDLNSHEGADSATLMGGLDRRSLYAVSSNAGGRFSPEEQDTAKMYMGQQQGLAMGLYAGPIRLQGEFGYRDPTTQGNYDEIGKAGINFLDKVSNEEKSSVTWAVSRASAQRLYESGMEMKGQTPENLDSDIPLVKLIRAAMATMNSGAGRGMTHGFITNADELKNQAWFKGFESRLDAAVHATWNMLQPKQ